MVPAGNPLSLASAADLSGVLVAKREQGAGTRVLLEQLLIAEGVPPHSVAGPELHSHLEVALAVTAGIADAGLGLRANVPELGLEFVPLVWESYDIALPGAALGAARPLITALRDPEVQESITLLGRLRPGEHGHTHTPLTCHQMTACEPPSRVGRPAARPAR